MADIDQDISSSVSDKIEQLMGELEKLKKENQILKQLNTTVLPSDDKENSDVQSILPRMGPRSREEKIASYDKEIKRIVKETEVEQSNSEFYESQERHYRGELAKLEQANFPNPKAEVLKQHFLEELDRISDERFTNLGTTAEQMLRTKLRAVRIDNIASQLASLKSNVIDNKETGVSPDREPLPDMDSADNEALPNKQWTRDDTPSPSSSSVSHSSYYRPWLGDHPASVVSLPHSQFSSNSSLPRLNCTKGKGSEVLFQEQFRKMQNNLLPSSATVQIPVKFRMNHHKRSSSASKTDNGSSPCVLRPQKPIPLCPTRSKSFTAPERMPGTRDSLGERLSSSIEKARSSVNSEDTRQTSFISGISDFTDDRVSEGPYSPVHVSNEQSDSNQERMEYVQSLLSKFEEDDHESFACTLQAVTRSPRHVKALFKKGVVEKSLRLLHGIDENWRFVYNRDIRERMGEALYNIVRCIYRSDKLALQIHTYVRMVRDQCERMLSNLTRDKKQRHDDLLSIREKISTGPFIQLSTYSHKPEAIGYMTQLGVLYAFGEYLVIDSRMIERLREEGRTSEEMSEPKKLIYIKRLICATLRNLTFRDPKNKVSICLLSEVMLSIVSQLDSENEDLLNSTASLLRNLAWKSEDVSKVSLTKCNATVGLVRALTQKNIRQDNILVNVTNGLVNLTNHSPENKIMFCAAPGAIQYMIRFLSYKSADGNSMVLENITGIFCNVSQHIGNMPDHMQIVRKLNALGKLVTLLSSDNEFVLAHVCGILNNLSASSAENVATLWDLRAPQLLDKLKTNKNKLIVERAENVLKHLIASRNDELSAESIGDPENLEPNEPNLLEEERTDPSFRNLDIHRVRIKDEESQTSISEINREDEVLKKIRKKSKQNKIPSFIKKLSFRKEDSDQTSDQIDRNSNQQSPSHFQVDTSPHRPDTKGAELPTGSQSSVKTLVSTQEYSTPQNSPQTQHYKHYPHMHHDLLSVVRPDEIYPQYPYAASYPYPHHLIDMPPPPGPMYPTRPMSHAPHIGYVPPHYMNMRSKYVHQGAYSAHNSPYKPSHVHASPPPPLRPNHFNQSLNFQYTQEPYRMSSDLQLNQISRHDAAIMKARLDKHSKSRSYTDSQGDLVTDL